MKITTWQFFLQMRKRRLKLYGLVYGQKNGIVNRLNKQIVELYDNFRKTEIVK